MTANPFDNLIAQGVAAAKSGQRAEARAIFEHVLKQDQTNLVAWWWLAQVVDDPQARSKYLKNARSAAAQSDQGRVGYRSLLQESGAPLLMRYELAEGSPSLGGTCPICTQRPKTGETVVICPACRLAHHVECWEDDLYHCGRFACSGSGLIDYTHPVRVEAAGVSGGTVVVSEGEVPEQAPGLTTAQREAGFVDRLRQQAVAQQAERFLAGLVFQGMLQEATEEQRRQEQERKQAEFASRVTSGCLVSLLPGILLAIAAFQYSQNWLITLFTFYLVITSIAKVAGVAVEANDRATSLYWLLPKAMAAVIMYASFAQWGNGVSAVILAYIGGEFLTTRILGIRAFYERRAFITYSILAVTVWSVTWFTLRSHD
jgi:hypothetical protein